MKIKFLHHSSFQISSSQGNILIDPFVNSKSDNPQKALTKSPCKESEFTDVSLILITHEHYDHFDQKLVECLIKRENALVVGHESVLNELKIPENRKAPVTINETMTLRGVEIEARPVHHPLAFYPLSYLIRTNGSTLYHAGDTDLISQFDEINADTCLLPIGGHTTMDIVDAIKATKIMKPDIVIPMHYNTFDNIRADPFEFQQKIKKSILKTEAKVLDRGHSVEL